MPDQELWDALQETTPTVRVESVPNDEGAVYTGMPRQISLDELARTYQLEDLIPGGEPGMSGFAIASRRDRRPVRDDKPNMSEIGSALPSPWTSMLREDYNNALRGKTGLMQYDKMRKGDGTVRSALNLVKTPVLSARWFMEPASDSARDRNVAEFIWKALTDWMSTSWPQFLYECLYFLDYGVYVFEKVFRDDHPDAGGKITWQKFSPRHPLDINEWVYDRNGGLAGVRVPVPDRDGAGGTSSDDRFIGIEKLLVFTNEREGGSARGVSILRPAYKHWYYKDNLYKIDAIQKERHGIGIPIISLPPNFTAEDRRIAEDLGRNLRTNERAHVVLPPNWEILFAKLEGQPVNALTSAEHHDKMIRQSVLAPPEGATEAKDQEIFLRSTRYIAGIVTDIMNKYAIPQLVHYNWSRVGVPVLRARGIGEAEEQRTRSFTVRNYVGAGLIVPDERLEEHLRRDLDLPPIDEATRRVVANPQAGPTQEDNTQGPQPGVNSNRPAPPQPPRVGMPRQNPQANTANPRANTGNDRSGG